MDGPLFLWVFTT